MSSLEVSDEQVKQRVLEEGMPFPAPNTTPAVNDFLAVKPERETSAFVYGQVTSVNGGTVEVKLADGKTRTARQGDFYLIN